MLVAILSSANWDTSDVPAGPEDREWFDAWVLDNKRRFARIFRYGVTDGLIEELNEILDNVNTTVHLRIDRDTRALEWRFSIIPAAHPEASATYTIAPAIAAAFDFCVLLERGWFDGIKRCKLQECRKFHVRRGKWCSDNCGSLSRVRKKRRLDKERQML